jgi:hypothetical protein
MLIEIDVDESLCDRARELTRIQNVGELVRAALETLIAVESGKRLAALGGTQPNLESIPRRRPAL